MTRAAKYSARNTLAGPPCGCGHPSDEHYLSPPRQCRATACACAGYQVLTAAPVARPPDIGAVAVRLAMELVDSSPLNPRKRFEQEDMDRLAASMEADGLLEPILVKPVGQRYQVVAGERRWRAAKQLGWTEIPAIVRSDVDDATHLRLALLENLVRRDLDVLEEAQGYVQLQDLGMSQTAIARAIGRDQSYVANRGRLLRAPHEILDQLDSGALSASHVLALLRYEAFPSVMRHLAETVVDEHVPVKEIEAGLIDGYELVRLGLARDLGYRAVFDTKVCEQCPFDARRAEAKQYGGESFYCLKPEHYDELQAAAAAERSRAAQKQLEKAKANGKQLPKLDKLDYRTFERLRGEPPAGCSEACACRGAGMDYGNDVVQICTDPKRLNGLKAADTRRANAAKREQLKEILDRLNDKLDLLEEFGERELAVLVKAAIQGVSTPDLKEAVRWSGGLIEVKDIEDYREQDKLARKLAALAPIDLVRLGVYAVLHHEARDALTGYGRDKPVTDWYLTGQRPRAKGKPLVEAFAEATA